jgi:transposase
MSNARQLDRIDRRLRRIGSGARTRVAREHVSQIRSLTRQINLLQDELLALVMRHRPQLLAEVGCGPLTAAILIGRTAGAQRFRTDASFALQAGTAPIKCSSGHIMDRAWRWPRTRAYDPPRAAIVCVRRWVGSSAGASTWRRCGRARGLRGPIRGSAVPPRRVR